MIGNAAPWASSVRDTSEPAAAKAPQYSAYPRPNQTRAIARSPGAMPLVRSTPITLVATNAVAISAAAWIRATMPMPTTLPISNCRGVITASSTSTTRDAFSRVTAVSTQPP